MPAFHRTAALAGLFLLAAPAASAADTVQQQADAKVARMTLDEKVSQLIDISPEIRRLDVPYIVPPETGSYRLALPAAQRDLLEKARALHKPLVVVSGGAIDLSWAKQNAAASPGVTPLSAAFELSSNQALPQ
jgi:hypothetical protein